MAINLISIGSFIVEYWIAYLYYNNIFSLKTSKAIAIIGGLSLYILPTFAFIVADNFFINLILYLTINFLFSILFFESSWKKCIISSVILTALLGGTEFIVMITLSVFTDSDINYYLATTSTYALSVSISKTLFLLLSILISRLAFPVKSTFEDRAPAFLFIFPISALFIDFTFWIVSITTDPTPFVKILIGIGSLVLLVSVLLTYAFYGKAMCRSQEFYQLQNQYEKVKVDKEYYSILDHQNEELRTFIHDEKNHLSTLKALTSTNDIHLYVDGILSDLQKATPVGNTKNHMLDLIIGKYLHLCNLYEIRFSYSTITANLSFMEDIDLVSMMSNILDNAVDATISAQDKWIDFTLESKIKGITLLTCANTSGKSPNSQRGRLITSKENPKQHGIGIKSVIRTSKKYNGEFEWSWDEQNMVFTAKVIFER